MNDDRRVNIVAPGHAKMATDEFEMPVPVYLDPFDRFGCFNHSLKALDVYYLSDLMTVRPYTLTPLALVNNHGGVARKDVAY